MVKRTPDEIIGPDEHLQLAFEGYEVVLAGAVEAARAEAFERAAQIAENTSFMMPIDWWMQSSKKEVSVESCLQVAAAIRQEATRTASGESGER